MLPLPKRASVETVHCLTEARASCLSNSQLASAMRDFQQRERIRRDSRRSSDPSVSGAGIQTLGFVQSNSQRPRRRRDCCAPYPTTQPPLRETRRSAPGESCAITRVALLGAEVDPGRDGHRVVAVLITPEGSPQSENRSPSLVMLRAEVADCLEGLALNPRSVRTRRSRGQSG